MNAASLEFIPVQGMPEFLPGDDLVEHLINGLSANTTTLSNGDVLVIAQKIVSKVEGRFINLNTVNISTKALELAAQCQKDPRLVELILQESTDVVRCVPGVLIVRHKLGLVMANAGIDQSNVPGNDIALLLPQNPDASADHLAQALQQRLGVKVAVLISDSFGRPFRNGVCGTCIGCFGLSSLYDLRGHVDREERPLAVTQLAIGDQLCATANLVCGESNAGIPAVVVRGLADDYLKQSLPAAHLVRSVQEDLFQ